MTEPRYDDEEWMREEYIVKGRTQNDIARELDVHVSTIKRKIDDFGFETHDNSHYTRKGAYNRYDNAPYRDEEWLKERWFSDAETQEIAKEGGCSRTTLQNWAKKFGFPSNRKKIRKDFYKPSKEELKELIKNKDSLVEVGEDLDKDPSTISVWASNYDIDARPDIDKRYKDREWLEEKIVDEGKGIREVSNICNVSHRTIGDYMEKISFYPFGKHKCSICNEILLTKRGLEIHLTKSHRERRITIKCEWCGEEDTYPPSSENRRFCNEECKNKYLSKKYSGKGHPQWKERVPNKCEICGTITYVRPSKSDYKTCGDEECIKEYRSIQMSGENNPLWVEGSTIYGKGWTERKKRKVRKRDNKKCQLCGMTQKIHKKKYNKKLIVHHKIKARVFSDDNQEKRNSMDNLITLCCICHQPCEQMSPLVPLPPKDSDLRRNEII